MGQAVQAGSPVTLAMVRDAERRIQGHVRVTPLLAAAPTHDRGALSAGLSLKLESLQVTGSFKARGASNKLLSLPKAAMERGVVTASGGNHGLAVAYAARSAGVPATIYLPGSAPADKIRRLQAWGAQVVVHGAVWDDSNAAALDQAARDGLAYVHPFADPLVIAGQGTVGTEILDAAPRLNTLLVAIGGGGLISGVALAARSINPAIRIIGVEPTGAPTLMRSLEAGRPVVLDGVDTKAGTLAPRSTDALNFCIIQHCVDRIVLVSDPEMQAAATWLWQEHGVAAELSGAAAVAAVLAGHYVPAAGELCCAVVCGAGTDGINPARQA